MANKLEITSWHSIKKKLKAFLLNPGETKQLHTDLVSVRQRITGESIKKGHKTELRNYYLRKVNRVELLSRNYE